MASEQVPDVAVEAFESAHGSGVVPFIAVVDSDFKGISPQPDEQLSLRTRMRSIVSEEFVALFGEDAPKQMGFMRNPADERITRPIDDPSGFMSAA
ncbi:hypothetical protein ACFU0W_08620 [Microbacterium keratanolyticum]|uniref:hypothetical protein n=1 Tax=Microbacterium keratanolyticum TaxID=67574 RepID=UPI003633FB1C